MRKNIWRLLQIAWLALAMFTAHNSILALNGAADYCADVVCASNDDCVAPCYCYTLDSICLYPR